MSESDQKSACNTKSEDNSRDKGKKNGTIPRKTKNFPGIIGFFSGVVAICLVFVLWWQQRQVSDVILKKNDSLKLRLDIQQASIEAKTDQIQTLERQLKRQSVDIPRLAHSISQMQGKGEHNWRLVEIEYLLRGASLQVQVAHDISGAITLLKMANDLIGTHNLYTMFPVKKGIEEDISALNGSIQVDTTGLWFQLNAVMDQVESLPLLSPSGFEVEKTKKTSSQPASVEQSREISGWANHLKRILADSWHFFSRQFYFRNYGNEQAPELVSPGEEKYLKQNIQIMLMQAQIALLKHETLMYKKSIEIASQWISTYFHNNAPNAKALQAKLHHMEKIDISPPLPVITHGLTALENYKIERQTTTKKAEVTKENHTQSLTTKAETKEQEVKKKTHSIETIENKDAEKDTHDNDGQRTPSINKTEDGVQS